MDLGVEVEEAASSDAPLTDFTKEEQAILDQVEVVCPGATQVMLARRRVDALQRQAEYHQLVAYVFREVSQELDSQRRAITELQRRLKLANPV